MTRNRKLLAQAVEGRRKVELRYDSTEGYDHPEKWRVFHPHALYPKDDGTLEVTGRQEVKTAASPAPGTSSCRSFSSCACSTRLSCPARR